MRILQKFILSIVICCIANLSSAFAQMEVEVGGKVEVQAGFRGKQSTAPYLIPSELRPEFSPSLLDGEERFESGLRGAIVTDSLIDIWATGTYDYECLGRTTYGAKIELFADPSANKYSMDSWNFNFSEALVVNGEGFIPGFPDLSLFTPFAVPNPGPAREVKIYLENCLGKFEVGDTIGASKHLQVDAATIAVGSGGIAGDARLWATPLTLIGMFGSADMITNKVAYYYLDPFFTPIFSTATSTSATTSLFAANGVGTEMRYTGKVSYYTPRYSGFAAGVSYIPDTDVFGSVSQLSNISRHDSPFGLGFKNVVEGGINYDCKICDVGVKASVLGEVGNTKEERIEGVANLGLSTQRCTCPGTCESITPIIRPSPVCCPSQFGCAAHGTNVDCNCPMAELISSSSDFVLDTKDPRAYEFGLGFDYCCFEVAGSYGVNRPLLVGLKDNRYWTLGAAYSYCDFGVSVNYMDNRQKSKLLKEQDAVFNEIKYREFVVDVEYRICDGLIPYASYAYFNVHQPFNFNVESRFKQSIGMIGLRVLF